MTTVLQDQTEDINEDEKNEVLNNSKVIYKITKRIFDIFVSILALPILAIFIIVFGILIKLEDGGSIFYTQKRVGRNLKEFNIYKMRSMKVNAEALTGSVWAEVNDPRITNIGKIIRKFRIDEFPQFLNVIKGDMSLIGPRPERLDLTMQFEEQFPGFVDRLTVKPGITGLAQVNGGYDITPKDKLEFDLKYIKNQSVAQDITILFKTVKVVLTGDGAR